MKIADLKDEYDIGDDEPASMKVPCASIDPLDKENIDTRVETGQDVVATVSTTAVSKFSKKPSFTRSSYDENKTPLAESFCNQSLHVTSLGKPTDVKIMSFGPKHYSQQFVTNNSTESFERVNPMTTLHHNEDLYASLQNQLKFKTSVEGYTLESQEGRLIHHQHMSSLESQPILIQSVLQECDEKQLMMQNPQSPEKTIQPTEMAKPSTPIHLRGQSQAVLQEECNNITKHHRFTSDTNFDRILNRKSVNATGQRHQLITPERKAVEERYNNASTKDFYSSVLKDLEGAPVDAETEEGDELPLALKKAPKNDQIAYNILRSKFGTKYSQGLHDVFVKYSVDLEMTKNKMAYSKFLIFMKNFDLFNQQVTKEAVALVYARRCPNKIIDFAAFVDILFKISKFQTLPKGYHVIGETKFQVYLDNNIFNKHPSLIGKNHEHKTPRFPLFRNNANKEEEVSMILLEQNNALINHIFTLYESFDIQYHNKPIIFFKDFKKFCYDYTMIPVMCTLNEMAEVFKRFQLGNKPIINFQGFVSSLVAFANIGFGKEPLKARYNTFVKRLCKFFEVLSELNAKLCDQMVSKHAGRTTKK